MDRSAEISACGKYRYRLDRKLQARGPVYAFIGVNPSTADATVDDATVRKWRGFVNRWGGSKFIVGNVFAYRSTDVRNLVNCDDPVGPDNFSSITRMCLEADIIVPCWGNITKAPKNLRHLFQTTLDTLRGFGVPVMAFGFSGSGCPRHPLMLGYATPLVRFDENSAPVFLPERTKP